MRISRETSTQILMPFHSASATDLELLIVYNTMSCHAIIRVKLYMRTYVYSYTYVRRSCSVIWESDMR